MMTEIYWMSASPSYEAEKNRTMYRGTSLTMAEKAAIRSRASRSSRGKKTIASATKSFLATLLSGVTRI